MARYVLYHTPSHPDLPHIDYPFTLDGSAGDSHTSEDNQLCRRNRSHVFFATRRNISLIMLHILLQSCLAAD
ncbi:MAG: hypothetical protein CMC82_02965 [Flavobacteriaceae bacterium]|nr:hypothetical protein [Flavobacteriaceae bacterium]